MCAEKRLLRAFETDWAGYCSRLLHQPKDFSDALQYCFVIDVLHVIRRLRRQSSSHKQMHRAPQSEMGLPVRNN